MKKTIIAAVALSLAIALPSAHAGSNGRKTPSGKAAPTEQQTAERERRQPGAQRKGRAQAGESERPQERSRRQRGADAPGAGGTITLDAPAGPDERLQQRLDEQIGGDHARVKRLVVKTGTLTADDCRFIRQNLTGLEELIVTDAADFKDGVIPRSAFEGLVSLRRIRADRAVEIGAKAFSLCAGLEQADFPQVTSAGVQAFAQAKGSSAGRLRTVRLPKLERMDPRAFYYCTNLEELFLTAPPAPERPEGKEGLWFERVTRMVIRVPDRKAYDAFVDVKNCGAIDWSAFDFRADNGDPLPETEKAPGYDDAAYDRLREELLPHFDRTDKDFSGTYYTGDFKLSLNLYTFNMNLNAWMNGSASTPQLSTLDAIRWAAGAGFDAVDVTCYYIPGYSNTAMPTRPEQEILDYARKIRELCAELGISVSGTGLQNNFADPNEQRRLTDVERIKFWIRVAAEMGAPVIRIFAGPPPADIRRAGWERIARERIVPHIREVAQYAREHYPSVRIGLQNHGGMLATANQVIRMLGWIDCDNVGIINDTGFYRDFLSTDATRYDWYGDIALVLPYTNNFQLKKKPAGAETWELMDLKRIMRDIRRSPYRGYLPIELLWVAKDEGYPGNLNTPPFDETVRFVDSLKQAIEQTASPEPEAPRPSGPHGDILHVGNDRIDLLENCCPARLTEQLALRPGELLQVKAPGGWPRCDLEPIRDGDRAIVRSGGQERAYTVRIKHYELHNLALNPGPERIRKSSFHGSTSAEKAFDGNATGFSGSGYQVDGSQASTPGKEQFWLAVDLGGEQRIDAFGVAWGTSVGQLKKRLRDGTYRVACTNDPAKWEALSDARTGGRAGLADYAAPEGWQTVYAQDVDDLPDANGNKVFIETPEKPVTARYVMVTGELASAGVEIYNFYVFQKQLLDGASRRPEHPTEELARILPDYPGMVLAPGRPALVRSGGPVPAFHIVARQDLAFEADLIAPDGKIVYKSGPVTLRRDEARRLTPDVTAALPGTYRMEFVFAGEPPVRDACYFTAVDEDIARYTYSEPYPALHMANDRLVYTPDYRGNRVIDYSHAGYGGGGAAIPNVPVKIMLEPSDDPGSDDTERIQRAVELLGRTPVDADGFRGTILLRAGTFRISRPILIDKDGIVIRGEGDGHGSIRRHDRPLGPNNWFDYTQSEHPEPGMTKVVATWVADSYNKNEALFNFSGGPSESGEEVAVTDQYVPAGTCTIHLADAGRFEAGDNIRIRRSVNAAWAQDLNMDRITDAPGVPSANQWAVDGKIERAYADVCQERTVAAVDRSEGSVTLTEPIVDPLDRRYGIPTVARFSSDERVSHAGVENLQLISRFDKSGTAVTSAFGTEYKFYDDERHAQVGVRIGNAENIWVRRITTYHIDVAVTIAGGSRWITIQDANCLEPVGGTGGERRYSFSNSGGSLVLNQRNYVRYTRHGFIVMGHVMGPNVFLNDRSDYQFDANEPHLRWSAGGLFDNMKGRIYVQNRWNNGTAHGWAGANYTLYNCDGKFIVSQNQLAANYVFGQTGERLPFVMDEVDPGNVPNFKAHEQSIGRKMAPESLYLKQLKDRLGQQAVDNTNDASVPACRDESEGFFDSFAYLAGIEVDGEPLPGFYREVLDYTVPVALDSEILPKVAAKGEKGTAVKRSGDERAVTFRVTGPGRITSVYTVRYSYVSKERICASGSEKQVSNLTDGDPATSWSQPGSPCVQFYLGDQPQRIEQVSLGYCRNTQSRRQYYFDFEISDDGYNWTRVVNPAWQTDNLGRGHLMGMQLMPGVGNSRSDHETFVFPANTRARLLRINMYGARFGRGSGTTNANAYWAIDVTAQEE